VEPHPELRRATHGGGPSDFAHEGAGVCREIARRLRIAFLYVDALDRETYEGAAKFDSSPQLFRLAFSSGSVAVYEVK
jgi:hypothetical protein